MQKKKFKTAFLEIQWIFFPQKPWWDPNSPRTNSQPLILPEEEVSQPNGVNALLSDRICRQFELSSLTTANLIS